MLSYLLITILSILFFFFLICPTRKSYALYALYTMNLILINFLTLLSEKGGNFVERYFSIVIVSMMVFLVACVIWSTRHRRMEEE